MPDQPPGSRADVHKKHRKPTTWPTGHGDNRREGLAKRTKSAPKVQPQFQRQRGFR